jgi:hypothetical protein
MEGKGFDRLREEYVRACRGPQLYPCMLGGGEAPSNRLLRWASSRYDYLYIVAGQAADVSYVYG